MPTSPQDPGRVPMADKSWLILLLGSVIVSRFFFLDMGFGRPDAWRVGVTGKLWVLTSEYIPSRPPGFPLLEMISTVSYALFGQSELTWIFTNALTCLVFCVSVWGIWRLARIWNAGSPLLIAVIYAFAPLNWVYSVETIDYLWMTSFLVLSVLALESDGKYSPLQSGILLGLATAARFSAAFLLVPLLIFAWTKRKSFADPLTLLATFLLVSLGFYAVILFSVANWSEYIDWFHELNRFTSGMASIEGGTPAKRFLMPASTFLGPLASIGMIAAGLWGCPTLLRKLRDSDRGVWMSGAMALFIMVPYLWHLHPNYWIPATGFLLILTALITNPRLFAITGALIILASFPWWQSNVEALGIFSPGNRNTRIETYARALAPYQNETVFVEAKVRYLLYADVDELMAQDLPSDWVIMTSLRLPLIQFLVDDIREIDFPLSDGSSITVWDSPSGGPRYKYMISPSQAAALSESGFSPKYLPGIENSYLATYGINIQDVHALEILQW